MNAATLMAKLAGIRKAVEDVLNENVSRNRSQGETRLRAQYEPDLVGHYFAQANDYVNKLKTLLPELYGDFQAIDTEAAVKMALSANDPKPNYFGRQQLERLSRDIDQVFEIRANSQLQQPVRAAPKCVFITHGKSHDWRAVQEYVEKDVQLPTIELAQQPNIGRTIIEKLFDSAGNCDSAVIVMTGDDTAGEEVRARENVLHEIGFFQGRYGRDRVVLLHEEGVNIPTNLSGVVYSSFPKGRIEASFHLLLRELKAMYNG
ncbi:nucleotide-binding protein [Chromobacterium sp. TRC.1.1.SA]|uniref:Nucleotide-binding protein n=1 Tax=Chromobacterium indicum TaxID=3110228 RepID=A0ABV0CJ62_9NEIS|nr:nucleotide-binding protein [Chromobacterium violaceum]